MSSQYKAFVPSTKLHNQANLLGSNPLAVITTTGTRLFSCLPRHSTAVYFSATCTICTEMCTPPRAVQMKDKTHAGCTFGTSSKTGAYICLHHLSRCKSAKGISSAGNSSLYTLIIIDVEGKRGLYFSGLQLLCSRSIFGVCCFVPLQVNCSP